nr:hypothetical protein [Tanacetum cinerariifolium]
MPLLEDFPTPSEERFPLLSIRVAPVKEIQPFGNNKWYQSFLRSFDQKKNNTQVQQNLHKWPSQAQVQKIRIKRLTNELEELKKEKEGLNSKLTGFESASKDLDTLLESQRSDKNKEGLPEFADDTITDYSRPSPSIKSSSSDLQDINSFVSEHGESSSSIMSKPKIKFVKAADCPGVIKNNKTETAKKSPVKYAEIADFFKTASVSVVRRVNTAAPRSNVNSARPKTTQDLVIIKLIQRVKRLERELKARTPPTKIHYVDVKGRSSKYIALRPDVEPDVGIKELCVELKRLFEPDVEDQLWTHTLALIKYIALRPDVGIKELCVELKRLFEPDVEDQLWTHTLALMHDPVEWRLYDTCGVHHVLTRDQ